MDIKTIERLKKFPAFSGNVGLTSTTNLMAVYNHEVNICAQKAQKIIEKIQKYCPHTVEQTVECNQKIKICKICGFPTNITL